MEPYIRVYGQIEEKFSGRQPVIDRDTPLHKGVMKSNWITAFSQTSDAFSFFRERGWTNISSGAFGAVYTNPQYPNEVLKAFHQDYGYLRFWKIAKNSENPHFPEISKLGRVEIPISDRHDPLKRQYVGYLFVVVVEKLIPWSEFPKDNHDEWVLRQQMQKETQTYLQSDRHRFPEWINNHYPMWKSAVEELKGVMRSTRAKGRSLVNGDLHSSNIMYRGPDYFPVIIDPFIGMK